MKRNSIYYILGFFLFIGFFLFTKIDNPGILVINCSDVSELVIRERISGKSNARELQQIKFKTVNDQIIINGSNENGILELFHEIKRCEQDLEVTYSKTYYSFLFRKVYLL